MSSSKHHRKTLSFTPSIQSLTPFRSRRQLIAIKPIIKKVVEEKRPPTASNRALQILKTPKNFLPSVGTFERIGIEAKRNYLETYRTLERSTNRA